ncbi:MAG: NrdH-redoxin [Actinobacteria bacterium]|nr:NrdH-redoxin [Actinomycetota bacterium]
MSSQLTMYSTKWCGYCIRLKYQLKRAGIPFTEIDIGKVPGAAAVVERFNGGNQTVPTVVLSDGTALTNPSLRDIQRALSSGSANTSNESARRNRLR